MDYQTEADRSSQKCIIASLAKHFPEICIVGEEGETDLNAVSSDWLVSNFETDCGFLANNACPDQLKDVEDKNITVWVDPLDGTLEFSENKVENTTVLIGVAEGSQAVAGVIHQPYFEQASGELGRTIWGVKGLGIGGMEAKSPPKGEFTIVTTRSHSNKLVSDAIEALSPTNVIRCGGAGFKVLQLLEGKAHSYVFASAGCKRWDTAAPEAVLEAAGGVLTDIHGNHYDYRKGENFTNTRGVLATAIGTDHSDVLKRIPDSVKTALV